MVCGVLAPWWKLATGNLRRTKPLLSVKRFTATITRTPSRRVALIKKVATE